MPSAAQRKRRLKRRHDHQKKTRSDAVDKFGESEMFGEMNPDVPQVPDALPYRSSPRQRGRTRAQWEHGHGKGALSVKHHHDARLIVLARLVHEVLLTTWRVLGHLARSASTSAGRLVARAGVGWGALDRAVQDRRVRTSAARTTLASWLVAFDGALCLALTMAGWQSPVRVFVALVFLTLGPGLAVTSFLGIHDLVARLAVAIGVSLAADTAVATMMIYSSRISGSSAVAILLGFTLSMMAAASWRRHRELQTSGSRGLVPGHGRRS